MNKQFLKGETNMQTEKTLKKNGRPPGSLGRNTIMKNAIKTLEQIANDPSSPPQARADAARSLIEALKS